MTLSAPGKLWISFWLEAKEKAKGDQILVQVILLVKDQKQGRFQEVISAAKGRHMPFYSFVAHKFGAHSSLGMLHKSCSKFMNLYRMLVKGENTDGQNLRLGNAGKKVVRASHLLWRSEMFVKKKVKLLVCKRVLLVSGSVNGGHLLRNLTWNGNVVLKKCMWQSKENMGLRMNGCWMNVDWLQRWVSGMKKIRWFGQIEQMRIIFLSNYIKEECLGCN